MKLNYAIKTRSTRHRDKFLVYDYYNNLTLHVDGGAFCGVVEHIFIAIPPLAVDFIDSPLYWFFDLLLKEY